uniref:Ig-like domain-containing protein n=1 Tax=Esox lucius TaxID=8010 RepID=A0A3P8ZQR4_ESOLU
LVVGALSNTLCCLWLELALRTAIYVFGCREEGDDEAEIQLDGNEIVHADFQRREVVWMLPGDTESFSNVYFTHGIFLRDAFRNIQTCRDVLKIWTAEERSPPEVKAPESTIYSREDVKLGENNTLICFGNNFFPPPVKMYWKKNGMEVTEGTSLSQYYPNKDGTFHQFSTLSFTPEEGDIYACTVEHTALNKPQTRFWGRNEMNGSSAGSAVFCGLGLVLGLLGVASGIFLYVKGQQFN